MLYRSPDFKLAHYKELKILANIIQKTKLYKRMPKIIQKTKLYKRMPQKINHCGCHLGQCLGISRQTLEWRPNKNYPLKFGSIWQDGFKVEV